MLEKKIESIIEKEEERLQSYAKLHIEKIIVRKKKTNTVLQAITKEKGFPYRVTGDLTNNQQVM